jgi:hypothetical protein
MYIMSWVRAIWSCLLWQVCLWSNKFIPSQILCLKLVLKIFSTTAKGRGGVRSNGGLGRTMTARGHSIGISIDMLLQTLIISRSTFATWRTNLVFPLFINFFLFVDNGFFNRNINMPTMPLA